MNLQKKAAAVNESVMAFRAEFFPDVTDSDWNDWKWQFTNRILKPDQLERFFDLTKSERQSFSGEHQNVPLGITPYYLSIMDRGRSDDPLRMTLIPVADENYIGAGETRDPLNEEASSPVPNLVHRYPDRVLFLVSEQCAVYCRYCTRSRLVGEHEDVPRSWRDAVAYIREHPEIRDVLLSGGDPLTLPDTKLRLLLTELRNIPHVEFLRIGTKIPAVMPQRITSELVAMLSEFHPLWMSIHFTHPNELTPEVAAACSRLADAGLPLGSQTVLLAGINDDAVVLKKLFHGLLRLRVRPYYLFQCDPIPGSSHFRTPIERGAGIISELRGYTTGYAVPTFVVDAPGGGGKVPIFPGMDLGIDKSNATLRNFEGKLFHYPISQEK